MIVLTGLSIGFIAGLVMHRSDYCIAGMFRDLFLFKKNFMLRTLMLLIVVSMVLFELGRRMDSLLYPFPLLGSPSLANVAGGFFFGIGMVLAGGCVVGVLYKMGAGSLVSLIAFIGLITGCGLYAEIHPWWSSVVKATAFFNGKITLPQVIGLDPAFLVVPVAGFSSFFFYKWYKAGKWIRSSAAEGYIQPWKAAFMLLSAGLLSYLLIGMPLGITTAYSKFAAYAESIFFPVHVESLSYLKIVSLNYKQPLTGEVLKGGPGPVFDAISIIQIPLIIGIVSGSAFSAYSLKEFRPCFRIPWIQFVSAFAGGVIMGLASRMAPACNVWHLMGGLPIFAVQSILFVIGLLPGAWLGSLVLVNVVMKNSE